MVTDWKHEYFWILFSGCNLTKETFIWIWPMGRQVWALCMIITTETSADRTLNFFTWWIGNFAAHYTHFPFHFLLASICIFTLTYVEFLLNFDGRRRKLVKTWADKTWVLCDIVCMWRYLWNNLSEIRIKNISDSQAQVQFRKIEGTTDTESFFRAKHFASVSRNLSYLSLHIISNVLSSYFLSIHARGPRVLYNDAKSRNKILNKKQEFIEALALALAILVMIFLNG